MKETSLWKNKPYFIVNKSSLPRLLVVLQIPLDGLLNRQVKLGKLKIRQQPSQLAVRGRLLVLSVRFAGVKLQFSLEVERLHQGLRQLGYRNFRRLVHGQDDRIYRFVVAQNPHEQFGQVGRVDELAQGFARTVHGECLLFLGFLRKYSLV